MTAKTPLEIVSDLWHAAGGADAALADLELTGAEPGLPSSFRVGAVAQATIAASALAAAEVWRMRGGFRQQSNHLTLNIQGNGKPLFAPSAA